MSGPRVTPGKEINRQRRRRAHACWDHLIVAPLWFKYGVNLGTLLRTCDAVGACVAAPKLPWVPEALARGNTLRRPTCVHWAGRDPVAWLTRHREQGWRVIGVELADEAIRLGDLAAARERTVVLLGHEHDGIPDEAMDLVVVEIPMIGTGQASTSPWRARSSCTGWRGFFNQGRLAARVRATGRTRAATR